MKEFLEQVNRDLAAQEDAVVEKTGRKQGDLPDIRRLELDKVFTPGKTFRTRSNPWEQILLKDVKSFESPSSMTEDSDVDGSGRDSLSSRRFKLSYTDLGVGGGAMDVKTTTAEEVTTSAGEQTDSAASEAVSEETSTAETFKAGEETIVESQTEEKTATTTDSEATETAQETPTEEKPAEEKKEEKKVEESGGWFSSLFGRKK
mmetsp:Transcript_10754/g.13452  ORF Transcript_10754/g.13452 Transcript_10754/m.13452 type:complete len:204 (-) Transcript_10754:1669-2280(-)